MLANRKTLLWGAVVGLLVLGVVMLGIWLSRTPPAPDQRATAEAADAAPVASADELPEDARVESAMDENIRMAIADFEYQMQFPPYSAPIEKTDWQVFNPRAQVDTALTLMDGDDLSDGPDPIRLSIEVPRGIIDVSEPLPVKVNVAEESNASGALQVVQGSVWVNPDHETVRDKIGPSVPLSGRQVAGSDAWEFEGTLTPDMLRPHAGDTAYLVAEVVLSDGSQGKAVLPVELFESKAEISSIGSAFVEGPHLMIPFELTAHVPGGFNVRANLLDDTGELPIAHLSETVQAESAGSVDGHFRVHIATLTERGHEGPYQLANINITKTLTKPDYVGGFGAYDDATYSVSGFSFSQYEDEDYVDPEMQRRLEGLQRMLGN